MLKKRHFYNEKEYVLDESKQVLILNKEFHNKLLASKLWGKFGFKKIGGSSIAEVLETDNFKSQFKAFVNLCRLDMPILDMKYIHAGTIIEEHVINKLLEQKSIDAIETFPAAKYHYDYFADTPIFGGLPDGLESPHDIVLEIKTTGAKKYNWWVKNGPPLGYKKQVQLYTYLMKKKKYAIVATFLEEEDYVDPHSYDINKRKTRTFPGTLDVKEIEDDISMVKNWYMEYTKSGISPKYNGSLNGDLLDYLKCRNKEEWDQLIIKWTQQGKINIRD